MTLTLTLTLALTLTSTSTLTLQPQEDERLAAAVSSTGDGQVASGEAAGVERVRLAAALRVGERKILYRTDVVNPLLPLDNAMGHKPKW